MENHSSRQVKPLDGALVLRVSGQERKLGWLVRLEHKGEAVAAHHLLGTEEEGHIKEDGVRAREGHVVHHRRAVRKLYGNALREPVVPVQHAISQVREAAYVVAEEVELSRLLVLLWVRSEVWDILLPLPLELRPPDCLNRSAAKHLQDVRHVILVEGHELIPVANQACVALPRALGQVKEPEHFLELLAQQRQQPDLSRQLAYLCKDWPAVRLLLLQPGGVDPPVRIIGLVFFQAHSMHHPIPIKPMVTCSKATTATTTTTTTTTTTF